MASKWLDYWAFPRWSDDTETPLTNIGDELKSACDERQASIEMVHSAGFDLDRSWPFSSGDLFSTDSNNPNPAEKIETAVYPKPAVETSTINQSGGSVSIADIPTSLTLSELLTGPLGYASGQLQHMTDTSSGSATAISKMSWVKQWFECLNYPVYYEVVPIEAGTGGAESEWVTHVETQYTNVVTDYEYTISPESFLITCFVESPRNVAGPGNDVYQPGDLNETAPWSTITEVRDYTISQYDIEIANDNWYTAPTTAETFNVEAIINYFIDNETTSGNVGINVTIRTNRFRFKIPDIFRENMPDKFVASIKWYGFYKQAFPDNATFKFDFADFLQGFRQ